MSRVKKTDVVAWKDALVDRGLSLKTISGGHLATLNTLYRFALENGLVEFNPAREVKVRPIRKAGSSRLPYTDQEVQKLLELAQLETLIPPLATLVDGRERCSCGRTSSTLGPAHQGHPRHPRDAHCTG